MKSIHYLFPVLLCISAGVGIGAPVDQSKIDEDTLKAAGASGDGPALLEFFRSRTLSDTEREKIAGLIQQLGDDSFTLRERASIELMAVGARAVPQLRQATRNDDIEIVRRAEVCLKQLDKVGGQTVALAATRLLAVKKPAGASEVLLKFLPLADEDIVLDSIRDTLSVLAVSDDKQEKLLVEALKDPLNIRRGVAGEALIKADRNIPQARKLLDDADADVRRRIGLALVERKDNAAIVPLIELLGRLPREQAYAVEDVLSRIALDKAPKVPLGNTPETRKKCRDAWLDWWDKSRDGIDLAKMDLGQRLLGYTLIVGMDINSGEGKVVELDKEGKVRWQVTLPSNAMDAGIIGNDRVLIAEYRTRKVTERNFKGEVLWEKTTTSFPMCAQRLSNGNTFIATRNQLLEVDPSGKEVNTITRKTADLLWAEQQRNGEIIASTRSGVVRMDGEGKELQTLPITVPRGFGSCIGLLPNGGFVAPNVSNGMLVVYDREGKEVKQIKTSIQEPTCVTVLPNGGFLVGSTSYSQAEELDKDGNRVREIKTDIAAYRLRRR